METRGIDAEISFSERWYALKLIVKKEKEANFSRQSIRLMSLALGSVCVGILQPINSF